MKALALFLFCSLTVFLPDSDKIVWEPGRPLRWSDFQGQTPPGSLHWAATNSGIKYSYEYSIQGENRKITFDIVAFMSPKKSWSIRNKQNPDLLRHEQLHFDISELHTRKLRRSLSTYEFTQDFDAEIKHIYTTLLKANRDMQDRYDEETDHSVNRQIQQEWEETITDGLKNLEDWAGHKVVNGELGKEE